MRVLLDASWEAKDIEHYCEAHDIPYFIITEENATTYDTLAFLASVPFCSTTVVQHHLTMAGMASCIPDTYETTYAAQFKRTIERQRFGALPTLTTPVFLKPCGNTKTFDGQIYYDHERFLGPLPGPNDEVYVCPVVTFTTEYRLFIGNQTLFGVGHHSGAVVPHLPDAWIAEIVALTKTYRCIDIGFGHHAPAPAGTWMIVEINPPFSLDDCGVPIDAYMSFCIAAWQDLVSLNLKILDG